MQLPAPASAPATVSLSHCACSQVRLPIMATTYSAAKSHHQRRARGGNTRTAATNTSVTALNTWLEGNEPSLTSTHGCGGRGRSTSCLSGSTRRTFATMPAAKANSPDRQRP